MASNTISAKEATTSINEETKDGQPPVKQDAYADAEENYKPRSLKFWLNIIGMLCIIFIVGLDRLIIATAIPKITDEFHSIDDIGWYASAYMLTNAIFNPLFGRIYKLYSTKWVFLSSVVIFEAGSALCGAAPNSIAFIFGRAIAGAGGAGAFVGGMMIIIPLVPLRKRPVFTSFFGLVMGISSVLGPILGGTFTDNKHLTWRWCFYINIPIGGAIFASMLFFLHVQSPPRNKLSILEQVKQLDPLGLFFFVPSMVCLVLALQWGGTTYAWSAPKIIGLLVTFAVTFILFIAVEVLMPETAMAPTRVILNRSVGAAMIFMLLLSGAMMAVVYYLNIWFQAAQGQSAMEAGIRSIPLVISFVVFGILVAIVTQKIGYYVPAMLLSPILSSIGCGMLSTLIPSSGPSHWIGYQVLYGIGIGFGFQTSNLAPQTVLPRPDVPLGMAMMFFMQQLGGSIFSSVAQNIFSSRLVHLLSGVAGLNAQAIINTGATELRSVVPANQITTVINAYSYALTRVFVMSAGLSACTLLAALAVEWRSIKKTKPGPGADKPAAPPDAEKAEGPSDSEKDDSKV